MKNLKFIWFATTLALLGGCTNIAESGRTVDAAFNANKSRTDAGINRINAEIETPKKSIERVKGAWLGSKATAIQSTRALPSSMDDFVYTYTDKVNLSTVASRITLLTGIPVRIQPDVFIRTEQLLPANATVQQPGSDPLGRPIPSSGMPQGNAYSPTSGDFDNQIALPFRGRLSQFLDLISAKAGVSWEYRDGAIFIFRLVSKTYTFKVLPGSSDIQSTVGKTGSTNAGSQTAGSSSGATINSTTASFNGTSQSSSTVKLSAWESIIAQIQTMLSRVGKVAANQSTGSITITDAKDIVEKAGVLIESENHKATRQVNVRIELLSISTTDSNEFGVDWNLVNTRLTNLSPNWRLTANSAVSTVSSVAGGVGFQVLTGNPNSPNSMNGSLALFKALREIGRTSLVTRTSRTTTNNQPTSLAITDQEGYLAYTTPATGVVGGSGGIPGLNPGVVTTGYILNLVPSILENDRILLQYSLDISDLKGIDKQSSGDYFIQTPKTSGYASYDRISLRAGETAVVTAYERTIQGSNKRGVTPDAGLGSFATNGSYQAILLLLTPVIIEGAI